MKLVKLFIVYLLIYFISSCGQSAGLDYTVGAEKKLEVMTRREINEYFGYEPRDEGSGVYVYTYRFSNGFEAHIGFGSNNDSEMPIYVNISEE